MTPGRPGGPCALCTEPATGLFAAPRRTLARGLDPGDPSYSVTVVLPDVALCAAHAQDVHQGHRHVGWCDDPRCRMYGGLGEPSSCGHPYQDLGGRTHA